MPNTLPIFLSTTDVDILLSIVERGEGSHAYRCLLRQRLESATILAPHELPGNVVTVNSRFLYRIDDQPPIAAVAVQSPPEGLADFALSIRTLRGLALLGLAEGCAVTVPAPRGRCERLVVERMLHRPLPESRDAIAPSAIHERWRACLAASTPNADGHVVPFRPKARPGLTREPDGGNPGPSAA